MHERRPLHLLDGPGDRGALAAAGDPEQGLEAVAPLDALGQRLDGRGLVAGRLTLGDDPERGHLGMVPRGCAAASGVVSVAVAFVPGSRPQSQALDPGPCTLDHLLELLEGARVRDHVVRPGDPLLAAGLVGDA